LSRRLREEFLKLLKEDEEFRYAVTGLIGFSEVFRRFDEYDKRFITIEEEIKKLRKDLVNGFKRHDIELEKLREDMNKGFERHDKMFRRHEEVLEKHWNEIQKLREDMNRGFKLIELNISTIGARWGIMSEEAFREGLKGLLKDLGLSVDKWIYKDEDGYVYGHPSTVELDIIVKDKLSILAELKSSVSRMDIVGFKKKAELYEKVTGKKPS